jgi:RNA 2',3'-cyclic 3'-phosphodiesterase
MSVIRAFIAINLSPEIYTNLEKLVSQVKQRLQGNPIRWVAVDHIHLTLKFLGDVSVSNLNILTELIQTEASQLQEFEISVGKIGAFPSVHRPRVIWVGVEAPPNLFDLQRKLEIGTSRLGYMREERKFSPHLTIGRIPRNANSDSVSKVSKLLSEIKIGYLGAACIRDVHLFRSDLHPGGAVYTKLFSGELNKTTE